MAKQQPEQIAEYAPPAKCIGYCATCGQRGVLGRIWKGGAYIDVEKCSPVTGAKHICPKNERDGTENAFSGTGSAGETPKEKGGNAGQSEAKYTVCPEPAGEAASSEATTHEKPEPSITEEPHDGTDQYASRAP